MGHVVLLGDSIFDNARYVPGRPAVIEQLRQELPQGWQATLLAVDGHVTADVERQLQRLPAEATHLVVSVGGNDALSASGILSKRVPTLEEAFELFHEVLAEFRDSYRQMLESLSQARTPAAVCTIYNAIPGLGAARQAALAGFNEVILHEAFAAGLPLIDLRIVCNRESDYSPLSPIEPSFLGGAKIARAIAELATTHDFDRRRSAVYL